MNPPAKTRTLRMAEKQAKRDICDEHERIMNEEIAFVDHKLIAVETDRYDRVYLDGNKQIQI